MASRLERSLAERIAYLQDRSQFSQADIAKRMGIDRTAFSKIKNGTRKVSADELNKLSEIFGVSTDYLLGNTVSQDGQAPSWATEKDKNDLKHYLSENWDSMTYGGDELTDEEKQQLRVAMETIFWRRHKHQ